MIVTIALEVRKCISIKNIKAYFISEPYLSSVLDSLLKVPCWATVWCGSDHYWNRKISEGPNSTMIMSLVFIVLKMRYIFKQTVICILTLERSFIVWFLNLIVVFIALQIRTKLCIYFVAQYVPTPAKRS